MFSIGTPEIVVILALALLVFGPKKMPEIGRSLGSVMRELRKASTDFMSIMEGDEPHKSHDRNDPAENIDDEIDSGADEPKRLDAESEAEHQHKDKPDHSKEGE